MSTTTRRVDRVRSTCAQRARTALPLAVVVTALLVPPAEAKIVEGRSVAGVKIGMTKAQVKRTLGKSYEVSKLRDGAWQFKRPRLQVGWGKNGRVDSLLLWDRKEKTGTGIGLGSSVQAVQAAYPAAECVLDPNESPYIPICFLSSRVAGKKTETYFRLDKPDGKVTEISIHVGSMRG